MSEDRNILNFIRTLCADGESGRLEILAGAVQGELSFAEGKLLDARFGHLTGFRAINAVAALRDARFSFDPAFTPFGSSSITASERVVLKQFFGIETVATNEYLDPVGVNWPEEATPAAVVSDAPEEVTIVSSDAPKVRSEVPRVSSEAPSVSSNAPSAPIPSSLPHASGFSYRTTVAFVALIIALLAAAAVLINKYNEPGSRAVLASAESPSRPAPVQQSEPVERQSTSTQSVPAPAPVKSTPNPVNTARDLSGKWNVVNTIETTSYSTYKNMKIGFALSINQNGSTFTGNGKKVSENGRSLPAGSRTPIQVKGSIKGDRIEATFFEAGSARKSNGKFVWRIDKAGRGLTGNFATSAARSSGKSAAIRDM
jgi:hypothetical protein